MILHSAYLIPPALCREAADYAESSKAYTSNRHDFHPDGVESKKQKMLQGKLGEKAVKMMFQENNIHFIEDNSPFDRRDEYDFLLVNEEKALLVDVKTRTKSYHTRTLEMVEQARRSPKHLYISARLYPQTNKVVLLGWFFYNDMIKKNQIENNGYLDNYVMYDEDLRPMESIFPLCLDSFKKDIRLR